MLLGSIAPLDPGQLTVDTYLGITVAGDEKMTPRELLTSVYHAVEASHLVTSNTGDVTADSGGIEINDENGWTLRIDGNELDSTDGLHLQKEHSDKAVAMYGNVDMKGNLVTNCGRVQIESSSVPLLFRETDQTGAGSLWRMPLDSRHLRFDASQNGTDFGGYKTPLALYSDGSVSIGGILDMNGHSVTNCGALVEANLQTPEELAAERIERFEQGDVLCWSNGQLEKCSKIGSPLVVAVADAEGKPHSDRGRAGQGAGTCAHWRPACVLKCARLRDGCRGYARPRHGDSQGLGELRRRARLDLRDDLEPLNSTPRDRGYEVAALGLQCALRRISEPI